MSGTRIFAQANKYDLVLATVSSRSATPPLGADLLYACRACAGASITPAAYSSARVFRPKASTTQTFSRAFRPAVVAAAAAPQLKDIDHSDIASKVKRQLLINGKFVDAIGGKAARYRQASSLHVLLALYTCSWQLCRQPYCLAYSSSFAFMAVIIAPKQESPLCCNSYTTCAGLCASVRSRVGVEEAAPAVKLSAHLCLR